MNERPAIDQLMRVLEIRDEAIYDARHAPDPVQRHQAMDQVERACALYDDMALAFWHGPNAQRMEPMR